MKFWTNSNIKSFEIDLLFKKNENSQNYHGNTIIDFGESFFEKNIPTRFLIIINSNENSSELTNFLQKFIPSFIPFVADKDEKKLSVLSEKDKTDFNDSLNDFIN